MESTLLVKFWPHLLLCTLCTSLKKSHVPRLQKCSNSPNNRARIKMKAVLERIFHKLSHAHIKLMIC